jgi:hypothetical protein
MKALIRDRYHKKYGILCYVQNIRFEEMFPDVGIVREVQQELDTVIEEGVINIVNLLKNQVNT